MRLHRGSRVLSGLLFLLLATSVIAPEAKAQAPCVSEYDLANGVLRTAGLPEGLSHRIETKLLEAQRKSHGVDPSSIDRALKQIDAALGLLGDDSLQTIPPDLLLAVSGASKAYHDCLKSAPPAGKATIRVTVSRSTRAGTPVAVEGARVRIEHELAGVTGKDGSLVLAVAANQVLWVSADDGANFAGGAEVTASLRATQDVAIAMTEHSVVEPSELLLDEVSAEGLLPNDFSALTLRFAEDARNVPIKTLASVALRTERGLATSLSSMFKVNPRGEIVATRPELVRQVIQETTGTLLMEVTAYDGEGHRFENAVRFEVGRHRLAGRLTASPATGSLSTGKLYLKLTGPSGHIYRSLSDETGNFSFSYLPAAVYRFEATRQADGTEYTVSEGLHLDHEMIDQTLPISRRRIGVNDVQATETRYSLSDTSAGKCAYDGRTTESKKLCDRVAKYGPWFDVPKGTKSITLRYQVTTEETVARALVAGGPNRDDYACALQDQKFMSFQWWNPISDSRSLYTIDHVQIPGTSPWFETTLDTSQLTANGPWTVRLAAESYNCCVGDNTLQTSVTCEAIITASCPISTGLSAEATDPCPPTLSLTAFAADPTPQTSEPRNNGYSYNDGHVYSIPRPGKFNYYPRHFTAIIKKTPLDATVSCEVSLYSATTDQEITTIRVLGNLIPIPGTADQYYLPVSFDPSIYSSNALSTPPPAHFIRYRFKLHLDSDAGMLDKTIISDTSQFSVPIRERALWRMPDAFNNRRFGGGHSNGGDGDAGGDSWASRGAYDWMDRNQILLTLINDISGEHGVQIGHAGHAYGTDIDIFHFWPASPGSDPSGQAIYDRLKTDAQTAQSIKSSDAGIRQAAQAAINELGQWVVASRTGIDNLLALPEVAQVGYILDGGEWLQRSRPSGGRGPIQGLLPGWGRDLLRTGHIKFGNGLDVEVVPPPASSWANGSNRKMNYWDGHQNHIHITLDRCYVDTDGCPVTAPVYFCNAAQVTGQPDSASILPGQSMTLSVGVSGDGPFYYQWYASLLDGTETEVPNSNSASITVSPTESMIYRVDVANGCGDDESAPAVVTVLPACTPPAVTSSPLDRTIVRGDLTTFTVTATGSDPLSYQWYSGLAGNISTPVPNGTGSALTFTPANPGTYWARVTNLCGTADSAAASVYLSETCVPLAIGIPPTSQAIANGDAAFLSVAFSGTGPVQFQWFIGASGDESTPVPFSDASVIRVSPTATTDYWVRVSNACSTAASASAHITVAPCIPPAITTQPIPATINAGGSAMLSAVASGTSPMTFQWNNGGTYAGSGASITVTPQQTTTYTATVSNACGEVTSAPVTVVVHRVCTLPSITAQPQGGVVGPGQPKQLTVAVATQPGQTFTYQWYAGDTQSPIAGATSSTLSVTAAGLYFAIVSAACDDGIASSVRTASAVVTSCTPPTLNPLMSRDAIRGALQWLQVYATGTDLTYQWYTGTSGDTSHPIPDDTTASVLVLPGDTTDYWVRVTDQGVCTADSNTIRLTVCAPPMITTQPAGSSLFSGNTATLTVAATPTSQAPLHYGWYEVTADGSQIPVNGNDSPSFTTPVMTASRTWFVRVFSGNWMTVYTDSQAATVHVCDVPEVHWASFPHPLRLGEPFMLQIMAPPEGAQLYWYRGVSGDVEHSTLFGGPVDSYYHYYQVVPDTPTATYWVRVKVGDCYADSSTLTLTVCVPTITQQPVSPAAINVGGSATLSVVATPAALTYQWYTGDSGDDSHPIANATSASYAASPAADTSYWVRVTGSCGATADSDSVLVTVCQVPHINANPTSTSVPHGGIANLGVFATGSNLTYQWYAGTAPDTSTPMGNLTSQSAIFTINPGVTTSYWVRVSGSCGTPQNSTTATVSVCPLVLQQPAAAVDTVMSGSTTTLTASGSEVPVYHWYQGETGDTSHPFGGNTPTVTTPAITAETKFWVMLSSGSCGVNSDSVTVHLCALPYVQWASSPHPLRAGEPFMMQIMAPPDGAQLYWYRGASGDVEHSTLLAGPVDSYYHYYQVVPDTPTATYWVRVKVGACYADSSTLTLTVCVPTITQQPAGAAINSGGSATLSVAATPAALTYQWYTGDSGDESHLIAGATSSSYATSPAADTTYWVRVTGSCGATANSDAAVVTVCQVPHIDANPFSTSVPHGGSGNLAVFATGSNLTYQWYAGTAPDTSHPIYNMTSQSAVFTINPGVTTSYWVRVSGSCGTPQNSTTATVSVCPLVLQQPAAAIDTVMSGSTTTLTASGSEVPVYHWYQGETGDTSHPFGGNTPTVTTPAITAETKFWVMLSSGSCSVNSDTVTVHLCSLSEVHWAVFPHPLRSGEPFMMQIMAQPEGAQLYWYRGVSGDLAHSTLLAGPIDTSYYYQVVPDAPTATYWVRVKVGSCYADSSTLTLVVCVPTITQQPVGAAINSGGSTTLTVAATPAALTYQWYTGDSGDESHLIAGATSSSYAASPAADTSYWVRVTGSCGATANSAAAVVTVCFPPAILSNASVTQWYILGSSSGTPVWVSATGNNLTYQWYAGNSGNTSAPIPGATSNILNVTPQNTTSYWVRVSGSCGVSRDSVTMLVNVCGSPAITTQPQGSVIFSGGTATLSVTATESTVTPMTYQWYRGAAGDASAPVGTNSASYTTPALTAPTSYWVRVSCGVCNPTDSQAATVSICTYPQILTAPADQFIALGQTATLTTFTGSGNVYQWYVGASGNTAQPAPGQSNLSSYVASPTVTTQYWARITNGGCVSRTQSATVNVCIPTITQNPSSIMINSGTSTPLSVTANTSGLTYQWYIGNSGTTTSPISGATGSSVTVSPSATTSYWVRVTGSCSQSADSSTATVTICAPPAITYASPTQSIVRGSNVYCFVNATGSNLTWQWYVGATGNTSAPVSGATSSSLTAAPQNTTSYWVRVSGSCGTVNSVTMLVNVSATPSITAQPQGSIIFSGGTATMTVTATEATTTPMTYQWYRGATGDISAPVGTNSASFTTPALTAQTSYWVRVSCGVSTPADSQAATISICNYPQVLGSPGDFYNTTGQTVRLFTANGNGNTYQWYTGASGDTSHAYYSPYSPNYYYADVAPTVTTQYWAQVTNGGCISRTATANVYVCVPTITQQPASVTIAGGTSTTLTASADTAGVTYQWYNGASGNTGSPIGGATGPNLTVTPGANASYWVRAIGTCGRTADSATATVTLCSPPVITGQPNGNTVWNSGTAYFWVYATGSNLTYQWYYGNSGDTTYPISGATSSTSQLWIAQTQKIWVRITGQCGAVNSNATFISVYPVIYQQPPATLTAGYNTTATISFSASNGNYTSYVWKNGSNGAVIATTTTPTLITPVLTADTNIYCEVWSGNASATTNGTSVSLCYNGPNVSITKAPNGSCSIAYTNTYNAESYEWYQGARGDTSHPVGNGGTALYVCPTTATQYWLRAYATSYGVTCYTDSNAVTLP